MTYEAKKVYSVINKVSSSVCFLTFKCCNLYVGYSFSIKHSRPSSQRVELEDWNGVRSYAKYGKFNIGDEQAQYRLELGSYSGTARDSLTDRHNHVAFSTKDRDNDGASSFDCATKYYGAWWYGSRLYSNLNGQYYDKKPMDSKGVVWNVSVE